MSGTKMEASSCRLEIRNFASIGAFCRSIRPSFVIVDLPQPPNQPHVDGCPMIKLQDMVEDVQYLLTALYDPSFHRVSQCCEGRVN
ncbi:hypothetical protein K438DRAFT_1843934 [Mycena galopus ATCC 62051]|nr:hypothetical protein K438DRAFT_1843934 [Mycena galopus ATCC 62051]